MSSTNMLMINRGIGKLVKKPAAPIMGFGMTLFFLVVYNAGIGGIGSLDAFGQAGYLSFIFPVTIQQFPVITFALKFINCFITSNYINRDHRELPFFREKNMRQFPVNPI